MLVEGYMLETWLADEERLEMCTESNGKHVSIICTPRTWDQALPFRFRKGSRAA